MITKILPTILFFITGHPRAKVENLKWSKDIWSRNIFRLWELIFWRRAVQDPKTGIITHEIRIESSHDFAIIKGEVFRKEKFYTWESSIGFLEVCLKRYIKDLLTFNLGNVEVQRTYAFLSVSLFFFEMKISKNSILFPMIAGAIAYNSANQQYVSAATSTSYSVTNTAGDYMLTALGCNGTPSTASYNSVSMGTAITSDSTTGGNTFNCKLWGLIGPATGANTLALTKTSAGSNDCYCNTVTYSGTNQSSQPDAFNHKYAASGTTQTMAVVVVASNCWLSGWGLDDGGSSNFAGSGFTVRGSAPNTVSQFIDSNGTVSTGSQNINYNTTGNLQFVGLGVSVKPAGAAPANTTNFFNLKMR